MSMQEIVAAPVQVNLPNGKVVRLSLITPAKQGDIESACLADAIEQVAKAAGDPRQVEAGLAALIAETYSRDYLAKSHEFRGEACRRWAGSNLSKIVRLLWIPEAGEKKPTIDEVEKLVRSNRKLFDESFKVVQDRSFPKEDQGPAAEVD